MPSTPDSLRDRVRAAYSAAAFEPGSRHPFPVGAEFAASVGYPKEALATLPQAAAAFAGVSNVALQAPLRPGMTVVDLGCGAGLDARIAAERVSPGGRVAGVDFSLEMLRRARPGGGAHFLQAAAESLPFRDAFADMVLINGLLNLNPYRERILREVARVLKPGGALFGAELILMEPLPDELKSGEDNWFS